MNKFIGTANWALMIALGIMAMILSYFALYDVAVAYGIGGWLAIMWPLIIDVPLIAGKLRVIEASSEGESTVGAWGLVIGGSTITLVFNWLHVYHALGEETWWEDWAYAVNLVVPILLISLFWVLTEKVKEQAVKAKNRAEVIDLEAKAELLRQNIEAMAQSEAQSEARLAKLQADLEAKQAELEQADPPKLVVLRDAGDGRFVRVQLTDLPTKSDRLAFSEVLFPQLKQLGITKQIAAEALGVTDQTIRNYVLELNGKVGRWE